MFETFFGTTELIISAIGSLVILYGVVKALIRFISEGLKYHNDSQRNVLDTISLGIGRHLVLGLEFFIASDLIKILIDPDWNELGQLGFIIILRTILSVFLTRELKMISEGQFDRKQK